MVNAPPRATIYNFSHQEVPKEAGARPGGGAGAGGLGAWFTGRGRAGGGAVDVVGGAARESATPGHPLPRKDQLWSV